MRRPTPPRVAAQTVVLLLIVLAILAGIGWWLFYSRRQGEETAKAFAREAAVQLAMRHNVKFLARSLGREAQVRYPPSFRERLLSHLRRLGLATGVDIEGQVTFTSHFFEPRGQFRARLNYPTMYADLDIAVSNPYAWWQIDYLNLTWYPPPESRPAPAALETPAPGL